MGPAVVFRHGLYHGSRGHGPGNFGQSSARPGVRHVAVRLGRIDRGRPRGHEQRLFHRRLAGRPAPARCGVALVTVGFGRVDPPVGRGGAADCVYGLAMDRGPAMGSLSRGRRPARGSGLRVERCASRTPAVGHRRYGTSGPAHRGDDRHLHHRQPGRDLGHFVFPVNVVGELDPGCGPGCCPGDSGLGLVVVEPSGQGGATGAGRRDTGWADLAGVPPGSRLSAGDPSGRQPVSAGAGS